MASFPTGGDPRFSARPGSSDPNADFYATPVRGGGASPGAGLPGAALPGAALPGRTPVPAWGKVLIGLGAATCALCAVAFVGAVGVPALRAQRAAAADADVQADLRTVAHAQEAYWSSHGTYTPDPGALGVATPDSDVAVLFADPARYCLGGRDPQGRGAVWYLSSTGGKPSTTPCA
ncbi:hypothetical protein [Kineococcus indalonis]|uniref:hypothetical protein n=1 Tax=Kineococcus indalonis TaxID=2696566 RepID=UPI00141297C8|nr:hypothetical protein [Kineococcus indalonis]NAZ84603.1 hypothetical protein [Kineococcus indalonis]